VGEAGRDSARALELAARAHEKLMRGTTKHLMGSVSMFRRAIEQDPYCPRAYAGLAEAMVRKYLYWDGDSSYLTEARDYCEQALALDPDCARAHTALGFAFHLSGHQTDAQREYRIAIQLDDEEWLAHRLLGAILRRNGNFKEAEPRLRRAIELHPSHVGSYDHLFNVLRRLDRHDEARRVAEHGIAAGRACLDQEPDNQEARLGTAILSARIGEQAAARELVSQALEHAPKDGYTSYLAGCVHSIMGAPDEAIELLKKAHDRGFYVQCELRNNDDLDVLRGMPEFEELVR
jgi:adenylate cyclase